MDAPKQPTPEASARLARLLQQIRATQHPAPPSAPGAPDLDTPDLDITDIIGQLEVEVERLLQDQTAAVSDPTPATDIALIQEPDFARTVLERLGQGITVSDHKGRLVYANTAYCKMVGYAQEELLGRSLTELSPASEHQDMHLSLDSYLTGRSRTVERRLIRADGTEINALITAVPRIHDDRITGVISVITDLTERIRNETALLKAKAEAEAASKAKSAFLANMSHELRTPLNAIIGYSELLEEDAADLGHGSFEKDLGRIRAAGRHLLNLINDILDLSKIEAGHMQILRDQFSCAALVQEVVGTVTPLMEQNGNQFHAQYDARDLGIMVADATKVRQVLLNLLGNAAKFTSDGSVHLSIRRVPHRDLQLNTLAHSTASPEWFIFEIQDTGIGMDAAKIERLFQAFDQGDETTSREYGGTGLGLALSQRFCEMMGGTITAQSAKGQGSIFRVHLPATIPIYESEAETGLDDLDLSAIDPSQKIVLVVDDDPASRDLLRSILTRDGFAVVEASNGAQGLAVARQVRPAIITLDMIMPGMNGWTMLAELKADPALASIPVILITVLDDHTTSLSLGASDYLTKPVNRHVLLDVVAKYRETGSGHLPSSLDTVLIVEDDPDVQEVLQQILKRDEWQVQLALNGQDALDVLRAQIPDLILLDLMMPVMDGFEFMRQLRSNPAWHRVPVIVVTAKHMTTEERQFMAGKVDAILKKGLFSSEELIEKVRSLIDSPVH